MSLNLSHIFSIAENRQCEGLIVIICLTLLSNAVNSEDWQSQVKQQLLQEWQQLANTREHDLTFIGVRQDYQLPACQTALSIHIARALQPGRNAIEIRCPKPYWNQYLAIQLHVYQDVISLIQPLSDKQLVTIDMIHQVKQDVGTLKKGFYTRVDDVIGQQGKRYLRTGTVLSPDMLQPPLLIKRGDPVTIRLVKPGIRVEMQGKALSSGRQQERIRVRNQQSQKVVHATVISRDLVQIE